MACFDEEPMDYQEELEINCRKLVDRNEALIQENKRLNAEMERLKLKKQNEVCESWGCLHRVSTNCPILMKWCGKAGK